MNELLSTVDKFCYVLIRHITSIMLSYYYFDTLFLLSWIKPDRFKRWYTVLLALNMHKHVVYFRQSILVLVMQTHENVYESRLCSFDSRCIIQKESCEKIYQGYILIILTAYWQHTDSILTAYWLFFLIKENRSSHSGWWQDMQACSAPMYPSILSFETINKLKLFFERRPLKRWYV
jgi:hypothetical protein